MDDLDEFFSIVGTAVSVYRVCPECDELCIINPKIYNKPSIACDPGYCPYSVPICLCKKSETLYDLESLEECSYPACHCGSG